MDLDLTAVSTSRTQRARLGKTRRAEFVLTSTHSKRCQDQQPPKNLYIEVRVLEDCGEILTESGSINLERNTTHFLRRSDVEHLVRQGMLEEV